MTTLITDSELRYLAIAPPRLPKGSHSTLTLPPPIAKGFIAGPENAPLIELFLPDSIASLTDRSPIALVGQNATGKTTMAATLLGTWAQHASAKRLTLTSAVEFSRALTRAIKADDMQRFRQLHRDCDGLLMDNVHELTGKPVAQDEFLSTLDHLSAHSRCVVVTTPELPMLIEGLSRSLQSRLSAGISVVLRPPGNLARGKLLQEIAAESNVDVDPVSLKPLAEAWEDAPTASELKGAFIRWSHQVRLNPNALRSGRAVDRLLDSVATPAIAPNEIAKAVCKEVDVTMEQLIGPSRKSSIVRARGLAMFLIRHLTSESYENIGALFSNRDHTTVMHACKKTEIELSSDADLNRIHDRIRLRFRRPR